MSLPRIGIGYDVHRLVEGRPLLLAGVRIQHALGLLGHSDADVVLHALTDALLGAIGGPDIGELFPDTDPAWAGADSRRFVTTALARVHDASYRVGNADIIVHAQQPRLSPHKTAMRASLAQILNVAPACVAVKATTNEGLDAIGRGEAVACWASVLLAPLTPAQ